MASLDEVKAGLTDLEIEFEPEQRLGNDSGWQLRLRNRRGVVNVFNTGNCSVQGREQEALRTELGHLLTSGGGALPVPVKATLKKVFVVYGHDGTARTQLEAMLRRWELEPVILDQLPSQGLTIIEKLEHYQADVTFAVVLATPDDEGHGLTNPTEMALRARQNVVLELGMMLTKLGRPHVAILIKDVVNMERPSDIQGLLYMSFKDDVEEVKVTLAKEMQASGYDIRVDRL